MILYFGYLLLMEGGGDVRDRPKWWIKYNFQKTLKQTKIKSMKERQKKEKEVMFFFFIQGGSYIQP